MSSRCGHLHGAYLPAGAEPGQHPDIPHDLQCTLSPIHEGEHEDRSFEPFGGSTFAWPQHHRTMPSHSLGDDPYGEPETGPEYGHGMLVSELFNDRRE